MTAQKPQSKLWFNDGIWWGSLFNKTTEKFEIYRLGWTSQAWSGTGVVIDERNASKADMLWDGNKLYAASAGPSSTKSSDSARILRYSYNSATKMYTLDSGFPVTVVVGGMEALVLAKDTTGTLWATYTRDKQVYVTHSRTSDLSWVIPFVVPLPEASNLTTDDISSVIAFSSKIGIFWSDQVDEAFYFAIHTDGAPDNQWSVETALQGPKLADDHMNLKADSSGKVYVVAKTSVVANGNDPLIILLSRETNGAWSQHTFSRKRDDLTRAILEIDEEAGVVYIFAAQLCCNGGVIYYKQAPLSDLSQISNPVGLGTPFIRSSTDTLIDNPSSTKQNLNSATGLVVVASDDHSDYYLHNTLALH